jgi:hypothetical protein
MSWSFPALSIRDYRHCLGLGFRFVWTEFDSVLSSNTPLPITCPMELHTQHVTGCPSYETNTLFPSIVVLDGIWRFRFIRPIRTPLTLYICMSSTIRRILNPLQTHMCLRLDDFHFTVQAESLRLDFPVRLMLPNII